MKISEVRIGRESIPTYCKYIHNRLFRDGYDAVKVLARGRRIMKCLDIIAVSCRSFNLRIAETEVKRTAKVNVYGNVQRLLEVEFTLVKRD